MSLLQPPRPPMRLAEPLTHGEAMTPAMREAIAQAQRGNFKALDKIELRYLNLLARIGELVVTHADGQPFNWCEDDDRAPFVVRLDRGAGRVLLEWGCLEKCRRCDGKLRRLPCRICGGEWFVTDWYGHEPIFTDANGVIVEGA